MNILLNFFFCRNVETQFKVSANSPSDQEVFIAMLQRQFTSGYICSAIDDYLTTVYLEYYDALIWFVQSLLLKGDV